MLIRLLIPLLSATLFFSAGFSNALTEKQGSLMFPTDAQNLGATLTGNQSVLIYSVASDSYATVLYESFNTSDVGQNSTLTIYCGSTTLLGVQSYATTTNLERWKMAKCTNSIRATTTGLTGSKTTRISLILTPYNIASVSFAGMNTGASTSFYAPLTASTSIVVSSEMTTGDLLLVLGFFTVIMLMLVNLFFTKV